MKRREFLRQTALLPALSGFYGSLVRADQAPPSRPSILYVDGLSFFSPDPADVGKSGLSAFICDVSSAERLPTTDGTIKYFRSFEACARSITAVRRDLNGGRVPGAFLATRGRDIADAAASGRTAVFLQFQGCEPIGEELSRLDLFYELGLRVLQITHHNDNAWGGGAIQRTWTGLTKVGREGLERLHALGIVPDLSHASDPTALDVLKASRKPVILSHGAARALVPNARCAPDEVIRGVADSGGVIGIFMMTMWLTTDATPTVDSYIRQIRHVIRIGGIDSVGIANDYTLAGEMAAAKLGNDNAKAIVSYWPWWDAVAREGVMGFDTRPAHVVVPALNDVRRMFTIHAALERAGFTSTEIAKIMGGNWGRVLTAALP
jgi:microsomal dipeptidase-like Zn-dependent dipeptidase